MKYIVYGIILIVILTISILTFFPKIAHSQAIFWLSIILAFIIAVLLIISFILEVKKYIQK